LAAAIGEATGKLAQCMRGAARRRLTTLWIDLVPQFLYPFVILLVLSAIVIFLSYFMMPKFEKIFMDYGVELPRGTKLLLAQSDLIIDYWYVILLVFQAVLLAIIIVALSSTARWF